MNDKKMARIRELVEIINKHNYNYYTLLTPTISDAEYDKFAILFDTNPNGSYIKQHTDRYKNKYVYMAC